MAYYRKERHACGINNEGDISVNLGQFEVEIAPEKQTNLKFLKFENSETKSNKALHGVATHNPLLK